MKSPVLKTFSVVSAVFCAAWLSSKLCSGTLPMRDALSSVTETLDKAKETSSSQKPLEGKPVSASFSGAPFRSIDLHTHSYCSDGDKSPEALVQEAKDMGVVYYALSDHDTVACLSRAQAKAKELGITLTPAMEVSAEDDSLHILAFGIDPEAPSIKALIGKANVERTARMLAIVEKLPLAQPAGAAPIDLIADVLLPKLNRERKVDGLGEMSLSESVKMTADHLLSHIRGQITRPDIAKALIAKKWALDNKDAFDRFLNEGHPAYVPMNGPSFQEAIEAIHAAGGLAVWAHPYTVYKFKKTPWVYSGKKYYEFEPLARDLMGAGLDGFQLYTPGSERFPDYKVGGFIESYEKSSGKRLLRTPGSDYHGGSGIGPKTMGGMITPEKEGLYLLSRLQQR